MNQENTMVETKTAEPKKPVKRKKGTLYIVLIVLFTLVMVADLAIYALTPDTSSFPVGAMGEMTMPDMDSMETMDADSDEATESDSTEATDSGSTDAAAGESTESADSESSESSGRGQGGRGGMGGFADRDASEEDFAAAGETPDSGFADSDETADTENMESTESGEFSGGFDGADMDMSEMPGGMTTTQTPLTAVRSYWLPILIVCILGDAVCIFLLVRRIRINRKLDAEALAAGETVEEPEGDDFAIRRERGPMDWIAPVCLILALALVIYMLPTTSSSSSDSSVTVETEILSGTAEEGTITTYLSGTGTLTEEDTVTTSIPDVVEVEAYYVENGDTVSAGDAIATVNATSVAAAIIELQSILDELDADLEEAAEENTEDTIEATVDARVKLIYAEEGDEVANVIYEDGALMLLSLDGYMAVDLSDSSGLSVGDSVTVTFSDGESETGRVAQVSIGDGTATVTVSDEEAVYGDTVTVTDEDGNDIGSGTLYIHSELKVTGYYGTVDSVDVDVDDEVEIGDTLLTLSDAGEITTSQTLLARRYELDEQMANLFQLYEDGCIYAEADGVISGVPDDAEIVKADDTTDEEESDTDQLSADNSLVGAVLNFLTAAVDEDDSGSGDTDDSGNTGDAGDTGDTGDDSGDTDSDTDADTDTDTDTDTSETEETRTTPYSVESGSSYVYYIATVSSVGKSSAVLKVYTSPVSLSSYTDLTGTLEELESNESAEWEYYVYKYDTTSQNVFTYADSAWSSSTASVFQSGDTLAFALTAKYSENGDYELVEILRTATAETETSTDNQTAQTDDQTTQAGMGGTTGFASGFSSGSVSGFSSGSVSGSASVADSTAETTEETASYDQYTIAEQDVLSITPQDTVTLSISVDELDILSLAVGMEAEVTLDALTGQSFTGTVTAIGTTGTNEGGNTKFTVELTLDRTEQMLAGMNASVKIETASSDVETTVPAAALVEDDGKTYVYTEYDEKEETLSGLVEVETGVSDGDLVEITSGLSQGDTYYYEYADTLIYSFTSAR